MSSMSFKSVDVYVVCVVDCRGNLLGIRTYKSKRCAEKYYASIKYMSKSFIHHFSKCIDICQ